MKIIYLLLLLFFLVPDQKPYRMFLPIIEKPHPYTVISPFEIYHNTPHGNLFTDYDFRVTYSNQTETHTVLGYYDGHNTWKTIFKEPGIWDYHIQFSEGELAAVTNNPRTALIDQYGQTEITGNQIERLHTVNNSPYLYWGESPWIKTGTNSPENFLALPFNTHGGQHGAISYLAQNNVNSVYMLLLNIGGDGDDVWPFLDRNNKLVYDTIKMNQWLSLFEHANSNNIALHLVLAETETSNYLDNGSLGIERKLFYREIVARFGHLPAIVWNISEESNYTAIQFNEFAAYIRSIDWANHPVTFHTYHDNPTQYIGTTADLASIQYNPDNASYYTEMIRSQMPVGMDEQSPTNLNNEDHVRRDIIYPVLFSGGNLELYDSEGDQSLDNFNQHIELWEQMFFARQLLESINFENGLPMDQLLHNGPGEVFGVPDQWYAVYLEQGKGNLEIEYGLWNIEWLNTITGITTTETIFNYGQLQIDRNGDWALLLTR